MSNSSSVELEQLWEQLIESKDVLRASQYTLVASATFFIYDMILTFGDEVRPIL